MSGTDIENPFSELAEIRSDSRTNSIGEQSPEREISSIRTALIKPDKLDLIHRHSKVSEEPMMKRNILTAVAAASMLAVSGFASAEPVQLSGDQMDGVTAGGLAEAIAVAGAYALVAAQSATATETIVSGLVKIPTQLGGFWVIGSSAMSQSEAIGQN